MNYALEQLFPVALETQELQLDTADEDQAIDQLTSRLEILNTARQGMMDTQSCSRSQIQDCMNECGLQLPDDCPINAFTEQPSSTYLTVAIESVWETTKDVVAAILQKLREILRKIFDYLRSLLDPILPYSKNYTKVRDNLAVLLATDEEISKLIAAHSGAVAVDSKEMEAYKKLEAEKEALNVQWEEFYTSLVSQVTANGPFMVSMRATAVVVDHAFTQVQNKILLLNAVAREAHRDPDNPQVLSDILSKLQNVINPVELAPFKASTKIVLGDRNVEGISNLRGYAEAIHAERVRLGNEKLQTKALDLGLVGSHLVGQSEEGKPYEQLIIPADALLKEIRVYETEVKELQEDKPKDDKNGQISAAFRAAAKALLDEFTGLQMLLTDCVYVNSVLYKVFGLVSKYAYANVNANMVVARASGDAQVIANCEAQLNRAKASLKPF